MSKKLLIAASLLAFSTAGVNATCQSFDGFSAGATVGFNVSTVKVKKAEKKVTENFTKTVKGVFDKAGFDAKVKAVQDADLADKTVVFPDAMLAAAAANNDVMVNANQKDAANAAVIAYYANKVAALKTFGFTDAEIVLPKFEALTITDATLAAAKLGDTELQAAKAAGAITAANPATQAAKRDALLALLVDNDDFNAAFNAAALTKISLFTGNATITKDKLEYTDAETNTQAHKNQVNFGLNVAYGHTFGKFYIGAGLMAEMNTGKTTLQSKSDAKSKTYNGLGHTYNLSTEVADVTAKETLKQKFSFGLRLKPGVTCGDWLFYVPVDLSLTKYEFKSERNEAANKALDAATLATATTPATYNGDTVTDSVSTTYTAASTSADATFKKNKTKFGYAFGLGAAVKLADNVSLDLAVTYSPNNKITVNTPNYTNASILDASGYGDKKKIKVSNYKATLGVSYHF